MPAPAACGPTWATKRHLDRVEGWALGLRSEARIVHAHGLGHDHPDAPRDQHVGTPIRIAKGRCAREEATRAPVPEVADVEDGVDHTRRIARGHLPHFDAAEREHSRTADVRASVDRAPVDDVHEHPLHNASRPDDEPSVSHDGGRVVEGICKRVEWEIVGGEREVWPHAHGRVLGVCHLVARPMIRASVEVAGRAGCPAVAPHLHVPEERLAERDKRLLVRDVKSESRWLRHRHASKGSDSALRGRARGHPEERASQEARGASRSLHTARGTLRVAHG